MRFAQVNGFKKISSLREIIVKLSSLRRTALASSVLLVVGCANAPGTPQGDLGKKIKDTFASDDPCSNNARNIGVVGGAVLGALLGNALGGGKDESRLIGAALGGVMGGFIGADMDRKRCELAKVAKKYDLDITYANIESDGDVASITKDGAPASATSTKPNSIIGNSVIVRDKDGALSHFESGSDQLTPRAKEYFTAIATQYAPEAMLAGQVDPKRKVEASNQLAQRHILLVGHTDDTGASTLNASLSEKRARAVAAFLKQKGVPDSSIYYQGAGESMPIADNRTEAGRAANRRVEIVEVADETSFKKYLAARKPQYAYYRPLESTVPAATPTALPTATVAIAAPNGPSTRARKSALPSVAKSAIAAIKPAVRAPAIASTATVAPVINFGGVPYATTTAKLDAGQLLPERGGFSLISTARADDNVVLSDCTYDRPRAVGAVKSLRDGATYKTSEHLPQLYGKTWASEVNGNLVVINRLAILRDGGAPANLPELKVYAQYKPGNGKKPDVNEEPQVNSYLVDKGVLYRMFPRGAGGLQCMDVLFGTDGASTAKGGKLVYAGGGNRFVADFKPQIQ